MGLSPLSGSPYGGTPYGGTPYVHSVAPTAPPSTLPSQRPTPYGSRVPTPLSSTQPSPTRRGGSYAPRRRSSGGGASGGTQAPRRRSGGSCCFGSSSTDSPPISPPVALPVDDEDVDAPQPDAYGYYYRLNRDQEVDFGTERGKAFRSYLNNLIHSTYQNCFITFKYQDPSHLDYIEAAMHMRYPNPGGERFSTQWLSSHIMHFLNNKKSGCRKAAKKQVKDPNHNYRPGQVHDREWDIAMDEKREELATGSSRYAQQKAARAGQTPTHYGSGGKAAWKDKFNHITLARPSREMVRYRAHHTEYETWEWLRANNHINAQQFDDAVRTLQSVS